jgi:hypothetical protein
MKIVYPLLSDTIRYRLHNTPEHPGMTAKEWIAKWMQEVYGLDDRAFAEVDFHQAVRAGHLVEAPETKDVVS